MNAKDAALILDVCYEIVMALIERGHLKTLKDSDQARGNRLGITKKSLHNMLSQIEKQLVIQDKSDAFSVISMKAARAILNDQGIGYVDFFERIMDGELNPCKRIEHNGTVKYSFYKADILSYREKLINKQCPKTVSVNTAAEKMGLGPSAVVLLCKKRLIKFMRFTPGIFTTSKRYYPIIRIYDSEIQRFKKTYFTSTELAKKIHIGPLKLKNLLKEKGVNRIRINRDLPIPIYCKNDVLATGLIKEHFNRYH